MMDLKTPLVLAATARTRVSRRGILAGIAAFGVCGSGRNALAADARPLANRLAEYVVALRYEDLDSATIERVKSHVIDTLGCGIAAFDERPVRICRDVALVVTGSATVIGTRRRTTVELA